ncbi:MAG: TetR/AcrR family transcriptional regulator [Clostridia bacterium]|nr:TetR/AcrR family transcriptional regulator [Clostridia bacterium]
MLTDKRIVKTRTAIKTAFLQLAIKNDIGKITVSNITETAKINRSTFYLHYGDIYTVLQDIEKEIDLKISSCIDSLDISDVHNSTYTLFKNLSNTLNESPELKNFILYSTSSKYIIGKIKDIFTEKALLTVAGIYPHVDKKTLEYVFTFTSSGIIDTYVKWEHAKDDYTSLDELIKTVSELTQSVLEVVKMK